MRNENDLGLGWAPVLSFDEKELPDECDAIVSCAVRVGIVRVCGSRNRNGVTVGVRGTALSLSIARSPPCDNPEDMWAKFCYV